MKIDRKSLLTTLDKVKPGLAAKESVEQSTSFIFKKGHVITFNDQIAVHAPLKEELEFTGAIPAKEFVAILSRFSGEEVEISSSEENEIRMKCGRGRAGIRMEAEIAIPLEEIVKIPSKWKTLPEDFQDAISACLPSTSKDLYDLFCSCIHFSQKYCESTDNARLTRYAWSGEGEAMEELLLTATVCRDLLKTDVVEYSLTKEWAHFRNKDNIVYSCRRAYGEYPDFDRFLEVENGTALELPEKLSEVLDRAEVFPDISSGENIRISVNNKGIMTVEGKGAFGWYSESLRIKWKGEEVAFSIHPVHLHSILSYSPVAEIGSNVILFTAENFQHVVAIEAE